MHDVVRSGLAALVLALIAPSPARGQDVSPEDHQEAQLHFELGRHHYDRGEFLEAAREFEAAIEVEPVPALYYNPYLAYRDAGDDERAAPPLRTYVQTLEPGPRRTRLEARLRVLEEEIASRADQADDAGSGEDAGAPRVAGPTDASDADDGGGPSPAPWIVVGAGGALIVAAVVTGVLAMDERSTLDALCPTRSSCGDGFEDPRGRGEALAIATDALWITGAAAVGAGLIWAIVDAAGDGATR